MKHVQTERCINDSRIIQANEDWGNLSFVELSNNCFDPAAQFRFRDNGAMLNLKRPGCLIPRYRSKNGLDVFYIYVSSGDLDTDACSGPVTQTSWGGLSVIYKESKQCAVPKTSLTLKIDPYIGLLECNDAENKRFNFGKFF